MARSRKLWLVWAATALALGGYLGAVFSRGEDKTVFLPGTTTGGHHQIEQQCAACHRPDFARLGDTSVTNEACLQCHRGELEEANDSHPIKKFRDPRTAPLLAKIDATRCVTCHREHRPAMTQAMGVTQPPDHCAHCHQSIAKDRPSHQRLTFMSCATSGCHNFHDNRALHESFLVRHTGEADLLDSPLVPALEARPPQAVRSLGPPEADGPADRALPTSLLTEWAETVHARRAGVNCRGCHLTGASRADWTDRPGPAECRTCHAEETAGFLRGKHGLRAAQGLSPMTLARARLPMKSSAHPRELGCASCHGAHRFDRRRAAVESCLECHDDVHTRNYEASPHAAAWRAEQEGIRPQGTGVSCATCHLPRQVLGEGAAAHTSVQHNQNANLEPNEKMVRTVCLHCHGLAFSIDAMADVALIENNFRGRPAGHVASVDMARAREAERPPRDQKKEETAR
jgi:hypothetical protein